MWKIVKLCFGLILLVIAIHGDQNEAIKKELFRLADQNKAIHGKFMPLKNGLLGQGCYGLVFKGKMTYGNKATVAMKFISKSDAAKREIEMYTYLNAVDNPEIERFGISNLYYYNEWEGHMFMVFSYFDGGDLIDGFNNRHFNEIINSLIVFREFVRQSKYMHSCGIRNDDIKPENIMLRRDRSFLIDFDSGAKLNEDHRGGTFLYISRKFGIKNQTRTALCDWESFLYAMCRIHCVPLRWFDNPLFEQSTNITFNIDKSLEMKANIIDTIDRIKSTIKKPPLKRIFLKFAIETFRTDSTFPDYDGMYDAIVTEIKKLPSPWFTWLTPNQIIEAEQELKNNTLSDIRKHIADPKTINFSYPAVNYERFHDRNA